MKLYLAGSHNPYHNVATERELFLNREECIYLWVNSPCVVIGRNQNPYCEVNLPYIKKEGISLVRRYSGGGAVFHDLGNLNYTYISRSGDPSFIIDFICDCLKEFSITAEKSGRNDILADGRKISGMASLTDRGIYLYHGTLMFDVNINKLIDSLSPSKLKLESKGISSVASRVINLQKLSPEISISRFISKISSKLGTKPLLPPENNIEIEERKLKSHEWIFSESPEYKTKIERRLHDSLYQFSLLIVSGKIKDVKVNTDDLHPLSLDFLCADLIGKEYDYSDICKKIDSVSYI
jgi:lipoate---protein ligase